MYYGMNCMEDCGVGLGQLHPEGKDCAEIIRIYKRELRNSKTRSKASHRKRHKKNAERFEAAYQECQGEPAHRIVPAAGGMPELVSSLTPTDVERIIESQTPGPSLDYTRIAGLALGGMVLLGGIIWLVRPKKQEAPK